MSAVQAAGKIRRRGFAVALLLGSLVLGAADCAISPKPEPPGPDAGFDLGQISTYDTGTLGPRIFDGGPGAAKPAGAVVRLVNLDLPEEPADGVVQPDGSFEVELFVSEGDEVRLQLIAGELRSEPLDVLVGPEHTVPTLAVRALADCLELAPATQIDAAAPRTIEVRNRCAVPVTLDAPYLRRPVTGLEVGEGHPWPAVLDPDFALSVQVQFDAPTDTLEEIIFIEVSVPERDRRPITVWPRSP